MSSTVSYESPSYKFIFSRYFLVFLFLIALFGCTIKVEENQDSLGRKRIEIITSFSDEEPSGFSTKNLIWCEFSGGWIPNNIQAEGRLLSPVYDFGKGYEDYPFTIGWEENLPRIRSAEEIPHTPVPSHQQSYVQIQVRTKDSRFANWSQWVDIGTDSRMKRFDGLKGRFFQYKATLLSNEEYSSCLKGFRITKGAERPNIILVLMDTLRADYIGAMNKRQNERSLTPKLDGLFSKGVVFDQALTNIPVSGPSYATLFTSLLPHNHGTVRNTVPMNKTIDVLAENLQRSGYSTVGVVANAFCGKNYGFHRGFDLFWDITAGDIPWHAENLTEKALELIRVAKKKQRPTFLFLACMDNHEPYLVPDSIKRFQTRLGNQSHKTSPGLSGMGIGTVRLPFTLEPGANELELITSPYDNTLELPEFPYEITYIDIQPDNIVAKWADRPELSISAPRKLGQYAKLILHNQSHTPLEAIVGIKGYPNLTVEEIEFLYPLSVEYIDWQIAGFLKKLRLEGFDRNTIVIFTSDHGEELGEHYGLTRHTHSLFDFSVRVPLLFQGTGIPKGERISEQVTLLEMAPTLLAIAEAEPIQGALGFSLLPFLKGEKRKGREAVILESLIGESPKLYGFRTKHEKFIHRTTEFTVQPSGDKNKLFDIYSDPEEYDNIFEQRKNDLSIMMKKYHSLRVGEDHSNRGSKLNQSEIDHLKAMGYLK